MSESDRLEIEKRRLEINDNVGRLKEVLLNELNTRRLQTRTIPVSPPVVPPRSSSVPLKRLDRVDKLVNKEAFNVKSLNLIRNRTCKKKYVSSELDTDHGEGIT